MSDSKPDVVITRKEQSDYGTFGQLSFNNFLVFTGELPSLGNQPNISCIPSGLYKCDWTYSPKFKRFMYEVKNVLGRSSIRIHSGNLCGNKEKGLPAHFSGCIGLGFKIGSIGKQKALLVSRPAVRQFEDLMKGKPFILEIR